MFVCVFVFVFVFFSILQRKIQNSKHGINFLNPAHPNWLYVLLSHLLVYIRSFIQTSVYTSTHWYIHTYIHAYIHTYIVLKVWSGLSCFCISYYDTKGPYIHTYNIHTYIYPPTDTYIYPPTDTYIYRYIHPHMHIYIHTYMHTI